MATTKTATAAKKPQTKSLNLNEVEGIELNGKKYIPAVKPSGLDTLELGGVKFIREDIRPKNAPQLNKMPFVLIRGYGSGLNYGYLKAKNGCEVTLVNSRRIWNWNKATETNQIACTGVDASSSKVTMVIPEKTITDCIEVLYITEQGAENLTKQPVWQK
jgi:hypothetical protein